VAAVERAAARNLPKRRQLSARGTVRERRFHSVEISCLLLLTGGGISGLTSGSFPARRRERRGLDDIGLDVIYQIFLDR